MIAPAASAVFAIGDSVMQGAGPEFYATLPRHIAGIEVDATPNRQMRDAESIVAARLCSRPPPDSLVVHLGTNGLFTEPILDSLIQAAQAIGKVVFVTAAAPRDWVPAVNERLVRCTVRSASSVRLVDWHAIASAHTDYLRADAFHLSRLGAHAYAEAIAAAVEPPPRLVSWWRRPGRGH